MFTFKQLSPGPRWTIIRADFPRRSAGEAFARDWFAARGFSILALDHDDENNALDIMAARGHALEQFAVELTNNLTNNPESPQC